MFKCQKEDCNTKTKNGFCCKHSGSQKESKKKYRESDAGRLKYAEATKRYQAKIKEGYEELKRLRELENNKIDIFLNDKDNLINTMILNSGSVY